MLNITHYQRNINQNHNEVLFHVSQNGCYPKVYKQETLERVWRKGNIFTQNKAEDLKRHLSKEDMQVAHRYMKDCSLLEKCKSKQHEVSPHTSQNG